MKCTDCVNWENSKCSLNYQSPSGEAEDECEEFSVLCCVCNEGHIKAHGKCCGELIEARRNTNLPCPEHPEVSCKGCPGLNQKEV